MYANKGSAQGLEAEYEVLSGLLSPRLFGGASVAFKVNFLIFVYCV